MTIAAWSFRHPDLDSGDPGLGFDLGGGVALVHEEAAVRQAILLLLSTVPGERVMRPDYGCDLWSLVFATNDDTTAGIALHYVREAIDRWEPRVVIERVDAVREPERPELLLIHLDYRLRQTGRSDHLAYALDLSGGGRP